MKSNICFNCILSNVLSNWQSLTFPGLVGIVLVVTSQFLACFMTFHIVVNGLDCNRICSNAKERYWNIKPRFLY